MESQDKSQDVIARCKTLATAILSLMEAVDAGLERTIDQERIADCETTVRLRLDDIMCRIPFQIPKTLDQCRTKEEAMKVFLAEFEAFGERMYGAGRPTDTQMIDWLEDNGKRYWEYGNQLRIQATCLGSKAWSSRPTIRQAITDHMARHSAERAKAEQSGLGFPEQTQQKP